MSNLNTKYDSCLEKCLLLLSLRKHSITELERKLNRTFDAQTIRRVIKKLEKLGYLDDLSFAKRYVELSKNRKSRLYIINYLRIKGINKSLITTAINDYHLEDEYLTAMNEVKRKTWGEDQSIKRVKITTFLKGKGFSYEVIRKVIDNY